MDEKLETAMGWNSTMRESPFLGYVSLFQFPMDIF